MKENALLIFQSDNDNKRLRNRLSSDPLASLFKFVSGQVFVPVRTMVGIMPRDIPLFILNLLRPSKKKHVSRSLPLPFSLQKFYGIDLLLFHKHFKAGFVVINPLKAQKHQRR